jgi:hypothetical protein
MANENTIEQDVQEQLDAYIEWAAGLSLTLTEEEIEEKRNDLLRSMGVTSALETAGAREVESWDEVAAMLGKDPGAVIVLDDYVKLDDKEQLINVPFFINRWWFAEGDQGEFAVMRIVASRKIHTPTSETDKVIVTDGSTGIFQQLRKITQKTQKTGAMIVRHGLRVSQYTAETPDGIKQAKTFYLT